MIIIERDHWRSAVTGRNESASRVAVKCDVCGAIGPWHYGDGSEWDIGYARAGAFAGGWQPFEDGTITRLRCPSCSGRAA